MIYQQRYGKNDLAFIDIPWYNYIEIEKDPIFLAQRFDRIRHVRPWGAIFSSCFDFRQGLGGADLGGRRCPPGPEISFFAEKALHGYDANVHEEDGLRVFLLPRFLCRAARHESAAFVSFPESIFFRRGRVKTVERRRQAGFCRNGVR